MVAAALSNPNSIVVGGHVHAYGADGSLLYGSGSSRIVATLTALKALPSALDGQEYELQSNGQHWRYVSASTLSDDGGILVAGATGIGSGAFIRTDTDVDIVLAITKNNTDAQVLYTVPAGFRLQLGLAWWEVTTGWTGGSSSAIGLSSSSTAMSTKGDVLGGSGGDVAATLVTTGALAKGTVGAKYGNPTSIFVGADTIRFDRITSAFTAGAGNAHVPVKVLLAPAS